MSLENYIRDQKDKGRFDSDGAFTLDQSRALQKLRDYQIANPAEFSASLVASAVASQADWINIAVTSSDFHLEHNGRSIPRDHLVNLFSSLLVSGPDETRAPVQELAFGLNALMSLKPSSVTVTCSDPESLVVLELNSGQLTVTETEPFESYGAKRRTSIQVKNAWRGPKRLFRAGLGYYPEVKALQARCALLGCPLMVNGQPLTYDPLDLPAACVARLGQPPSTVPGWGPPVLELESDWNAWVGLCPDRPATLTAVIHAVTFPVQDPELPAGLQAFVFCNEFRKDLSRAGIVQDDLFKRCLSAMSETREALFSELPNTWRRVDPELWPPLRDLLNEEARQARESWQSERAEKLDSVARRLRG